MLPINTKVVQAWVQVLLCPLGLCDFGRGFASLGLSFVSCGEDDSPSLDSTASFLWLPDVF